MRVPTEGKVMTVGADMEAPEGVVIETVAMPPGWTYELKRKDDHIVGISWKMDIKPGEFAEFHFRRTQSTKPGATRLDAAAAFR